MRAQPSTAAAFRAPRANFSKAGWEPPTESATARRTMAATPTPPVSRPRTHITVVWAAASTGPIQSRWATSQKPTMPSATMPSARAMARILSLGPAHRPDTIPPMLAHGHDRSTAAARSRPMLVVTLALTGVMMVVEFVAGLWTGSLALLADAGHMLTDATALALALIAAWLAARPPTPAKTYGYYRAEILAALANALLLFGVAGSILVEAWHRVRLPAPVLAGPMAAVAALRLAVNLVGAWLLHRGAGERLTLHAGFGIDPPRPQRGTQPPAGLRRTRPPGHGGPPNGPPYPPHARGAPAKPWHPSIFRQALTARGATRRCCRRDAGTSWPARAG